MCKYLLGLMLGIGGMFLVNYFKADSEKPFKYIQLNKNYHIDGVGNVSKGTILRLDESMSEGFTRYILYLNLKDDNVTMHKTDHKDEVIPYWLSNVDSMQN